MNDRFSAQVRQHLLGTADERPTDGQLAILDARVLVTTQRRPFVARLLWTPGRIGAFPSAPVRYGLIALALLGATLAAALFVGGGGLSRSTVFEGTWTSTDVPDGSAQTLFVAAGNTPVVHFEDAYATGDACRDDTNKRFTADGTGEISENRLDVSWPHGGGCILRNIPMGDGSYQYDPATDTVRDQQGITWYRTLGGDRPTPVPATDAPGTSIPSQVPVGRLECAGIDPAGGAYQASVGGLTVSATVPAGWDGLRGQFSLQNAPCIFGSSLRLEASLVRQVYADACRWRGTAVEAATPAAVIAALAEQTAHTTTGPTETTVAGYPASRFDFAFPAGFDAETLCDDGTQWLFPGEPAGGVSNIDPGSTRTVYVVDVEGTALVFAANAATDDSTAAQRAEIDAIIASLRIEP